MWVAGEPRRDVGGIVISGVSSSITHVRHYVIWRHVVICCELVLLSLGHLLNTVIYISIVYVFMAIYTK